MFPRPKTVDAISELPPWRIPVPESFNSYNGCRRILASSSTVDCVRTYIHCLARAIIAVLSLVTPARSAYFCRIKVECTTRIISASQTRTTKQNQRRFGRDAISLELYSTIRRSTIILAICSCYLPSPFLPSTWIQLQTPEYNKGRNRVRYKRCHFSQEFYD